mgnify:CR=1 FL=1
MKRTIFASELSIKEIQELALSIKQPWSYLICKGYKDIENRNWSTPFRGRIYVHAGKQFDSPLGEINPFIYLNLLPAQWQEYIKADLILGAIIGEVSITNCVTKSNSPWFVGKYGFILSQPILYEKPIPYKGQLKFFPVFL